MTRSYAGLLTAPARDTAGKAKPKPLPAPAQTKVHFIADNAYTGKESKNNENIHQLLSNRASMPEAMADDVFVKHSMTQNSENSNTDMQKEDGNQATRGDNGKKRRPLCKNHLPVILYRGPPKRAMEISARTQSVLRKAKQHQSP